MEKGENGSGGLCPVKSTKIRLRRFLSYARGVWGVGGLGRTISLFLLQNSSQKNLCSFRTLAGKSPQNL